jgi:multisubunit Na+/H+ antiporter MnhE subunit
MDMAKLSNYRKQRSKILAGWAFLAMLYVILSSSIEAVALVTAAVCASASIAVAAPLLRGEPGLGTGLSLRHNARIAGMLWRDCIAIARASYVALRAGLTRRDPGTGVFRERRLAGHARADIAALALSLAPNSYVVDIREQDERVVFHHLIAPEEDDPSREVWPP